MELQTANVESARRIRYHLRDLKMIISKMSMEDVCMHIAPELDIEWWKISQLIRKSKLTMTSANVAGVLIKYVSKCFTGEEIERVMARVQLKSVAIRPRTWHVINLLNPIEDVPADSVTQSLSSKIKQAMRNTAPGKKPRVHSVKLGDLVFTSLQLVRDTREGSVVYAASAPGEPVALVSSMQAQLMKPFAIGLGYYDWEDACLSGRHIPSLLRIANKQSNAASLTELPTFTDGPCAVRGGIDFMNSQHMRDYVRQRVGPDPPVLDYLKAVSEMDFFDPDFLNKRIKVTLQIKSDNILQTLAHWGATRTISVQSELFDFYAVKSNQIHMAQE